MASVSSLFLPSMLTRFRNSVYANSYASSYFNAFFGGGVWFSGCVSGYDNL